MECVKLNMYADAPFFILLQQQRYRLLCLKHRWSNNIITQTRLDSQISEAANIARCVTGYSQPLQKTQIQYWTAEDTMDAVEDDSLEASEVSRSTSLNDVIEDISWTLMRRTWSKHKKMKSQCL